MKGWGGDCEYDGEYDCECEGEEVGEGEGEGEMVVAAVWPL